MNESNKSSPPKGDFIDLERNQYKKRNKIKKYIIIVLSIFISTILIFFYINNLNVKDFISKNFDNNGSSSTEGIEKKNYKKGSDNNFNEQITYLNENIDLLKQESFENTEKLSRANRKISDLTQQLNNYESRRLVSSEFYYAEKYIILNCLLSLKNKFDRRQSFKKELDTLISIFNNKPEVKSSIINLQDIEISNVTKVTNLLDKLNEKISFYEVDIDRFINTNFDKTSREFSEILNSRENLVNYVKEIFNSTYKVTRVNDYSEKSEKIPYEIYNFRQVLVKAKEYLIIGNLQGAVEIFKLSNIDDNEIDIWVEDASRLSNIQEKLRLLESQLLDIVGEISD